MIKQQAMRVKQLLTCLLILWGSIAAHAYDFDLNGVYYNITDAENKTVEVTFVETGEGNADFYHGDVTIPGRVSNDNVTYTVTAIGDDAFHYCSSLTSVTVGSNVTRIGSRAFMKCTNLQSITLPDGLQHIGYSAFDDCYALANLDIPSTVTEIEGSAFSDCRSFTSLVLPEGITTIGEYFMDNCAGIKEFSIPKSVTTIASNAFGGTAFTSVYVFWETPIAIASGLFPSRSNATLFVPFGSQALYGAADGWKDFKETGYTFSNMETWQSNYASRFTITHDGRNNTIVFTGAGDYEHLYTPIKVEAGKAYELSVDYSGQALNLLNDKDCLNIMVVKEFAGTDNYSYISTIAIPAAATTGKTLKTTFRATDEDLYIFMNFGYLSDGVTQTLHFDNWQLKEAEGTVLQELQKQTFTVEAVADDEYKTVSTQALDMAAIRALLGTDTPVVYSLAQNGEKTKQYNLDPFPGFWCDGQGKVMNHDDAATRIGYAFVDDHLEVYQKPCAEIDLGGDYVLYMYLVNEETGNWVTVETNVHVTPVSIALADLKMKMMTTSEAVLPFQNHLTDGEYPSYSLDALNMSAIRQAVGTDNPVVYAMDKYGNLTKRYTLTPTPGFWMDADGKVCRFTRSEGDCHIGYAFVGDHMDIYQNPGIVKNGDTYELGIYFVNESTKAYAQHTATITLQSNQKVGDTFTAPVPCGDGTANLTFKITNENPWEVEVSASPEDIAGALTIPTTVTDETGVQFAVKGVGYEAFQGRQGLVSVVLPEGLTKIWDRGFNECGNIERVILPSTLENIYQGAFMNCTSLAEITLPSGLTKVSLASFQNTPLLKSINLPEGITIIEYDAFRDSGLESIKFPSTLTEIGESAFRNSSLTSVQLKGDCEVKANAFYNCDHLQTVTVESSVRLHQWNHFSNCAELKTFEVIPTGVVRDWYCDALLADCPKLESVTLYGINLGSVNAFLNCYSLKAFTFLDDNPGDKHFCQNFQFSQRNLLFNVPDGSAEKYLKKGYANLSDLSALPLVQKEFEDEASSIESMMAKLTDGDKQTLQAAIHSARARVNSADNYVAVYDQIAAIKSAASSYLLTATIDEGFDVTPATLTNPDFENLELGWEIVTGWSSRGRQESQKYENGEVVLDKFVEAYRNDNVAIDNGYIAQTIVRLPAGIYRFEGDVMLDYKEGAQGGETGVSLIAGNKKEVIATDPQKPQHFSLSFENPTMHDVKIGIHILNTNAKWIAADNFRLFYESKAAAIPAGAELKSSETDTLYLYNVDADKYLSAGHAYGTHAILDETGLPVRLTQNEETGLWQIYFWEGSLRQQLLFKHTNENVWVDYNGQSDGYPNWSITDAGDGTYLIQSPAFLGTDKYLGNNPSRQDSREGSYNGYTNTDVIAEAVLADNVHWQIFTKAACDMIIAKRKLMDAILRMEASGMTDGATLLSTAKTVYENDEATIKEVIDITTLLNSQMGMPKLNAPIDMTALITNPRFEENTTEGWSGANVVGGRSDATSNHEQEFYEKEFNMYQTITGVPNGRYMLKWKGLHRPGKVNDVYAQYKAGTDNASAVVYANDVKKTMKNWASEPGDANTGDWSRDGEYYPNSMEYARRCFDAGLYADELEVEVKDNVLTIGVKNTQSMSGGHWVIFSDFELYIMENEEQMYHKLSAEDVKCVPGVPFTYNINLTNRDEVTAFQFEMTLPEGVSIYEENGQQEVQLTNRGNGHMFSCTKKGEGNTYLFSALSLQSKPFKKNSGALVRMTLQPAEGMELGDYEVKVTNVELSKPNGMQVLPFDFTTTLTVKEADPGDVNGDGMITVTDAVYVFRYVNGQVMPHFQQKAADVNGDKQISINDAVGIVNMILGTGNASLLPSAKGAKGGARVLKRLNVQKLTEARYY